MASCMSENESVASDDSDFNYIPGVYETHYETFEVEDHLTTRESDDDEEDICQPYADEPLADQEWLATYRKEREEKEEQLRQLQDRLEEKVEASSWCTCGRCKVTLLQNARECQCCRDIRQCIEALGSDFVLQEVEAPPVCITLHPGFRSVCLDKWSLRQAAGKYRTMDKKRYQKTGLEETYLRSVSYREFTQLVHGHLGSLRIPLPACAYNVIRKEIHDETEVFCGFEDNED